MVSPYREQTASGITLQGENSEWYHLTGKKQRVVSPYRKKNSEWYNLTGEKQRVVSPYREKNSEWYHLTGKKTADEK